MNIRAKLSTISLIISLMVSGYSTALAIEEKNTATTEGSQDSTGSGTVSSSPTVFPAKASAAAEAAAILAAGTYGGPMTQYCEKLAKQLKETWKKVDVQDDKNNSADCRVDETGKIVEAIGTSQNLKDYLLHQKPIKNPPTPSGKPLWLNVSFDKTKDTVEVQLKNVDFGSYLRRVQKKIKYCWYPPKGQETKRMSVAFNLNARGELSDLRVLKESGSTECDACGLKAVSNAAPFDPFPDGAPENIDVQFAFDYNVFSNNANKTEP